MRWLKKIQPNHSNLWTWISGCYFIFVSARWVYLIFILSSRKIIVPILVSFGKYSFVGSSGTECGDVEVGLKPTFLLQPHRWGIIGRYLHAQIKIFFLHLFVFIFCFIFSFFQKIIIFTISILLLWGGRSFSLSCLPPFPRCFNVFIVGVFYFLS